MKPPREVDQLIATENLRLHKFARNNNDIAEVERLLVQQHQTLKAVAQSLGGEPGTETREAMNNCFQSYRDVLAGINQLLESTRTTGWYGREETTKGAGARGGGG